MNREGNLLSIFLVLLLLGIVSLRYVKLLIYFVLYVAIDYRCSCTQWHRANTENVNCLRSKHTKYQNAKIAVKHQMLMYLDVGLCRPSVDLNLRKLLRTHKHHVRETTLVHLMCAI